MRAYSNSAGYYTFDGGQQKSIKVQLTVTNPSATPFRAPFYMGDGGQNITLKNLVIENAPGTAASYATSLPQVFYTNGQYTFEADVRTVAGQPRTYSAGVVSRSKMPVGITGNNGERLDTIKNNNNVLMGNEIRGFGYGIVTLGMGDLIKGGVNQFTQYYNQGTRIENNTITNVARAGIYLGHEEGAVVTGNKIYQIGSSALAGQAQSAGIMAGGDGTYNTGGLRAVNNEVSGVSATTNAWGIVVDQRKVERVNLGGTATVVSFPVGGEKAFVGGNVVWGLSRSATTGSLAGIHLLTRRGADLLTPADGGYFTVGDSVVNNTVVLGNDNVTGTGAIVGVGVQNANGPVVMNNAIALLGNANAATLTQSALLFQGTLFDAARSNDWYLPSNAPASMVSNRNAFHVPNSGIARFVEVSHTSELVSAGTQDEFKTLSQWRTWTGQDVNSVEGNFVAEHEFRGIAPNQQLRVKVTPQAPIGSILNDRGERVVSLVKDLDGQQRGATGLGFDIGADEFDGRLYVSDLEVQSILSPGSYKSTTGATSDAEHIMTTAPVDVMARIRNSGALPRTNANVTVKIYMETAASNNAGLVTPVWTATPAAQKTVAVDLNSGVSTDVDFNIDGFVPQAYQQLVGYTVPARLGAMALNVTPRYRIEVTTPADENNANNASSKVVRFFVKRSLMSIVVSTRGAALTLGAGSTTNEIAGRLNGDSLMKGFTDLGWVNNPALGLYSYDVLDRNGWEPRSVDYTIYRTMFWSHDQTALTRTERDDIRNFIDAGTPEEKKNLALGSQEFPSKHTGSSIAADVNFVNTILRATNAGNPAVPNYNNKRIVGRAIARNTEETVLQTTRAGDVAPNPAVVRLYSDPTTAGIALAAYSYKKGDRTSIDSIAGTATASLTANTVYMGIDWRHFNRTAAFTGGERVLRGIIDFFEKNGGTVVPVELVSFDAKARGNNVDVFWATASEQNADHFVVERAAATAAVAGNEITSAETYVAVSTVAASGNTTERRDYGVKDLGLADGTYLYRLVMVDRDGSTSRTGDVEVVIGQTEGLSIDGVVPMPVVSTSTVSFRTAAAGMATVTLVDGEGRVAATLYAGDLASGTHTVDLAAAQLASGAYTVVVSSNGQSASMPVTIVK